MSDFDCNFSMELKYPLDAETLDILTDTELNKTNRIWFVTKSGKKVPFVKVEVLDKIRAEIQRLRGCSCSCSDGIIDDVEDILDKYKAESEE